MATFVVFWSVILAVFCFCISSILKGILAVLMGFFETLADVFVGLFFVGGAALLLYLLTVIVKAVSEGTFWSAVGYIVLFIIVMGIILSIVGPIGAILLSIAAGIAVWAAEIAISIFDWLYTLFENGYAHFLKVIMVKLELIEADAAEVSDN